MKKTLFISISTVMACVFLGCSTNSGKVSTVSGTFGTKSGFSDETYVWENFEFTTNKVQWSEK